MSDESCHSCMDYKKGDCIGHEICDQYRPTPTSGGRDYWPKTMRSRTSYAGNNDSQYDHVIDTRSNNKRTKKKYNPSTHTLVDWKKKDYDKELGIKRMQLDCPKTASVLLRYLNNKVIAWISYEEIKDASGMKYAPKCMLQLNEHIQRIDYSDTEKNATRAMFRGFLDVVNFVTKPCMIYLVVDRTMLDGIKTNKPVKNDDFLCEALTVLIDKKCRLTEYVVQGGTELIKRQIDSPIIE